MLISFSLLLDGPETTVQFKSFCQIEIPRMALIKILIEPLTIFSFCRCMSPQVACSYSDLLKISIAWVETVTGGWAPTISAQSMSKGGRIPSNFLRSPTIGVWPSKCLDIFPPWWAQGSFSHNDSHEGRVRPKYFDLRLIYEAFCQMEDPTQIFARWISCLLYPPQIHLQVARRRRSNQVFLSLPLTSA